MGPVCAVGVLDPPASLEEDVGAGTFRTVAAAGAVTTLTAGTGAVAAVAAPLVAAAGPLAAVLVPLPAEARATACRCGFRCGGARSDPVPDPAGRSAGASLCDFPDCAWDRVEAPAAFWWWVWSREPVEACPEAAPPPVASLLVDCWGCSLGVVGRWAGAATLQQASPLSCCWPCGAPGAPEPGSWGAPGPWLGPLGAWCPAPGLAPALGLKASPRAQQPRPTASLWRAPSGGSGRGHVGPGAIILSERCVPERTPALRQVSERSRTPRPCPRTRRVQDRAACANDRQPTIVIEPTHHADQHTQRRRVHERDEREIDHQLGVLGLDRIDQHPLQAGRGGQIDSPSTEIRLVRSSRSR